MKKKGWFLTFLLSGTFLSVVGVIFFTSIILKLSEGVTYKEVISAAWIPALVLVAGFCLLAFSFYQKSFHLTNQDHKTEAGFSVDKVLLFTFTAIVGGFIIYLVILMIQPRPLISNDPGAGWWSAVSICVAIIAALLGFISYYRSELNDIKNYINGIKILKLEQLKEIDLIDIKLKTESSQKILKDYFTMTKVLIEGSNIEKGFIKETIDKVFEDLANISTENKHHFSTILIAWSIIIWKLIPAYDNDNEYSELKQMILKLRREAFNIDQNNLWTLIYYAYAYVELDQGELSVIKSHLDSILASIELRTNQLPEHDKNYIKNQEQIILNNQIYSAKKSIEGKYNCRIKNFKNAKDCFNVALANSAGPFDEIGFISCLIALNEIDELKKRLEDHYSESINFDNDGFKTFIDLAFTFSAPTKENYDRFYSNFYVMNTPFFTKITAYERYPFFNFYEALIENKCNDELIDIYLIYFHFWGDSDIEAKKSLTRSKINELEQKLMSKMYGLEIE